MKKRIHIGYFRWCTYRAFVTTNEYLNIGIINEIKVPRLIRRGLIA